MTERRERLADLARRLRAEGYDVRNTAYFSDGELFVRTPPVAVPLRPTVATEKPEVVHVIEATVFVYPTTEGWQLRVTQHGGGHWVRDAASEAELVAQVRDCLTIYARPPGPGWREV